MVEDAVSLTAGTQKTISKILQGSWLRDPLTREDWTLVVAGPINNTVPSKTLLRKFRFSFGVLKVLINKIILALGWFFPLGLTGRGTVVLVSVYTAKSIYSSNMAVGLDSTLDHCNKCAQLLNLFQKTSSKGQFSGQAWGTLWTKNGPSGIRVVKSIELHQVESWPGILWLRMPCA